MKLVLGGNGFIGKHLIKSLLEHNLNFISPSKKELNITNNLPDINDIDHVYHLIAKCNVSDSWSNFANYHLVNVFGTINTLEFCRRNKCSMTYISGFIYGNVKEMPIHEKIIPNPNNPYAFTKYQAEQICKFYANEYKVPIIILRVFNVFGPGQSDDFMIPRMINQFIDKNVNIVNAQSLIPRRDYIYIDDVIDAIHKTTKLSNHWSVYNVGSGVSYSVEDLLKMIQTLLNSKKNYVSNENHRKNEILDVIADITKIYNDYKWMPSTSLKDGLLRTINSLQQ